MAGVNSERRGPRIELLVIQPTPFCNLDCRYCYLPDRSSKAVVAPQTLSNLFSQVFASGWLGDCLSVVWHAGEPLVLPVAFYRNALRIIDGLKPAEVLVTHSFQTTDVIDKQFLCSAEASRFSVPAVRNDGVARKGGQDWPEVTARGGMVLTTTSTAPRLGIDGP